MKKVNSEYIKDLEIKSNKKVIDLTCLSEYLFEYEPELIDHLKDDYKRVIQKHTQYNHLVEGYTKDFWSWINSTLVVLEEEKYKVLASIFNFNRVTNNDFWCAWEDEGLVMPD